MNEHTEKNINEALDWLQQTGGQIQDFATTQAPLYCQEVVAWTFWQGMSYVILGILLLAMSASFAKKITPAYKEFEKTRKTVFDEPWAAVRWSALTVVLFILGFGFVAENIGDTIKAKVAPRLVIVEHLKSLNR